MRKFLLLLSAGFLLMSCTIKQDKNVKIIHDFYNVFSERKDVDKLMDFYSTHPIWEDGLLNSTLEGKDQIKSMYGWEDSNFKNHPNYSELVSIKNILANDSVVAVSGQYNPYYYNGNLIPETPFTSWFYLNKEGKIEKQVEWIQYSLKDLQEMINFKTNARIH